MKNLLLLAPVVIALSVAAGGGAIAQSIDYGSLEQLFNEHVTTSATGSPQRATEAPVDMTIITSDDIKRSGATDLPTILSRVAGIDVLNWSAGDADLSVRGYDQPFSPRLLVLIDGRDVYLDDFGYTAWSSLPVTLADIRQIEVVRGPNSALFGFNAVGGVINIITFNPEYDTINGVEAHGGSLNDGGGSVEATLHLADQLSMRLSGGGQRQDEWRNTAGMPAAWSEHAMVDAVAQLAPKTDFRVQGSWSRSRENDVLPDFNAFSSGTLNDSRSIKGALTSDTAYGEIQAQAYVNTLEFKTPTPVGLGDAKNQIEVASLQDLFKIGTRNTVRLSLEYRDNEENTTPLSDGHIGYDVLAPSAMWSLAATQSLSLTAAGRLDDLTLRRTGPYPAGFPLSDSAWSRTTNAFSANLGAVYKPTAFDTLRATYARGIQIPSLVEYGAAQVVAFPPPYTELLGGNPALKPAVISNYELSYDRILPNLNATASAKVFYQETDDVNGAWDLTAPSIPPTATTSAEAVFENAATSRMAGFELSATGKINGGFHWSADTTYTNVHDRAADGYNLISRSIDFAATSPKFRGNVAGGWSDPRWAVDFYVHYVTAYDTDTPAYTLVRTPGYVTLAGRIGYELSHGLVVALSGQNLTTPRQNQSSVLGLQAPRHILVSLSKSW